MKTEYRKYRKSLSLIISLMMIFAAMALFAGCGGPSTLEEYVNDNEDTKTQIESIGKSMSNSMMDGKVSVEGNTINLVVKFKETYSDDMLDTMKSSLDTAFKGQADTLTNMISDLEDETDIDGIVAHLEIQNGDGSVMYNKDYKDD